MNSENLQEHIGAQQVEPPNSRLHASQSIFQKRLRKFRGLKRGYYSFLILLGLYAISFALPALTNEKALFVQYQGRSYLPLFNYYEASEFGMDAIGEPNYRELAKRLAGDVEGWVLMPLYPYGPNESLLELDGVPPHPPSAEHPFGTDDRGRDVFVRLAYGFNVSITFAILVTLFSFVVGIIVGAMLGYFGGSADIFGQRLIEIWSSLPFLYTIIIVGSIVVPVYVTGQNLVLQPSFWLLIFLLSTFSWMGITYYVRGEFYREKAKDYVGAAIALGASETSVIFKHILPNAITPVVSFAPFSIVANISTLVALDFLGFGLPAPIPSWGELIGQGVNNLTKFWLVFFPLGAVFLTLLLVVFVGEAIREAFDPKEFSRLH